MRIVREYLGHVKGSMKERSNCTTLLENRVGWREEAGGGLTLRGGGGHQQDVSHGVTK